MSKEKLLAIIKKILNIDEDLAYLLQLEEHELAELVVAIRQSHERLKKS
jgi:hypothetical protein